jgi:hypothetical protein
LAKRDATAAVIGAGDLIGSAIAKTSRGYRLDQPPRRPLVSWVDDRGSMPILGGRMRGIRSIRERDFYSGEFGAGPIRPFAAINRWFNRRTRRGSMLSINAISNAARWN